VAEPLPLANLFSFQRSLARNFIPIESCEKIFDFTEYLTVQQWVAEKI
jgi:hypothetical protein